MPLQVGELSAPIRGNLGPFSRDLAEGRSMGLDFAKKIGEGMNKFGESVAEVGKTITKSITIPLTGAAIAVFKLGKDFESEMSKVTGLVGVAKDQVDAWGKEIIDLAPDLGKAPKELASALFFVTSAGIRGAAAMDVLESSAKASTAGLGETAVIADLVTSAMNAYGVENLSASKATDILVAAVREGKAEAAELAATMGAVLPLASELGVTFDQVAATQAAMTKTGTNAAEAATQLKGILAGLIKPSQDAEKALDKMGTSSAEMRKKIREDGLLSALMDLREMTSKYGEEAMARVFPNIRALLGVLDLMGSNLEGNIQTFDAVRDSQGSLDKAFEAASNTLEFKWNSAINKVKSTMLGFFDIVKAAMLPVLDKFILALDFVSNKFKSLSPTMQKTTVLIASLAAVVGPAVFAVGSVIAGLGAAIAAATTIIGGFATAITTVGLPALAGIGVACAGVLVALTGLVAGIAAGVAAMVGSFLYFWRTNEDFRYKVIGTWTYIKTNAITIFNELKTIIILSFNKIKTFWGEHGEIIKNIFMKAWKIIFNIIKLATDNMVSLVKIVSAILQGDWKKALTNIVGLSINFDTLLRKIFSGIKLAITSIWYVFINIMVELIKTMANRIAGLSGMIKGIFSKIAGEAFAALFKIQWGEAGAKIVKTIANGMLSNKGLIKNAAKAMVQSIRNTLPFSPAKEGPLKDLDKIDFASSIIRSLEIARKGVKLPSIQLGNDLMSNLLVPGFSGLSGSKNNSNINFNGDFYFEGISNTADFMKEMRKTIIRYGGRNSF